MQPGSTKVTEKQSGRAVKHDGEPGERAEQRGARHIYKSPNHLPEDVRVRIAESLNARLADGLDLHSQIKVAHWNIKGPYFAALHPLFEKFAEHLAKYNDEVAERAVTLGARAFGMVRQVSKSSRLPEYPSQASQDMEHVQLLAERIEKYLEGLRETRELAEESGDTDSHDMIVVITTKFEKYGWFLRASLES